MYANAKHTQPKAETALPNEILMERYSVRNCEPADDEFRNIFSGFNLQLTVCAAFSCSTYRFEMV
jgi:hypothetical protein